MASDNKKTPGALPGPPGPPPTLQEYRKEQARLREMIEKQKQLSKRLVRVPILALFSFNTQAPKVTCHSLFLIRNPFITGAARRYHHSEGIRIP